MRVLNGTPLPGLLGLQPALERSRSVHVLLLITIEVYLEPLALLMQKAT